MNPAMNTVPDRIGWAVDVVDPGPADRLLEFGCGPGVAAELVCARLTEGRLLAIDRSAVAVERTTRRNADHVRAGRLSVLYGTGPTGPDRVTAVVAEHLRTSGFTDIEILSGKSRAPHIPPAVFVADSGNLQ